MPVSVDRRDGAVGPAVSVVTISASFGAGGSVIGPAVAQRLGVAFVDRAIPARVSDELGVSLEDALNRDERVQGWWTRCLATLAPISGDYLLGHDAPVLPPLPDSAFRECTRTVIRRAVADGNGVILGRAGALVPRDQPGALHVRLDGDPARRARQAARETGISRWEADRLLTRTDAVRAAYLRHFYRADPTDARLYHLVLDSTRLRFGDCVDLIVLAAKEVQQQR
jgi:cytidylate kinase